MVEPGESPLVAALKSLTRLQTEFAAIRNLEHRERNPVEELHYRWMLNWIEKQPHVPNATTQEKHAAEITEWVRQVENFRPSEPWQQSEEELEDS